jgi:hypothetical protein
MNNHIDSLKRDAKIIQALHVARYALVTHSGARCLMEGDTFPMDFSAELDQIDEVMVMLGVDLTQPLPAPTRFEGESSDEE